MGSSREVLEDRKRGVTLEVLVQGSGPDVVLVPSAMRGAEDFAHLQNALSEAGFRSLAMNPRNAGASAGPVDDLTLYDVGDDVAFVVENLCEGPAHLVGHALGNIVVRAAASFHPEIARSVITMPGGGHDLARRRMDPEVVAAVGRCHDESLSDEVRLAALRTAFFAPGNDPSVWIDGWWPESAGIASAIGRTDPELWWDAGGTVAMLIVQPLDDPMAAPEVGRSTAEALGPRARYVEIADCSHAILPERPEAVAEAVIAFLREVEAGH